MILFNFDYALLQKYNKIFVLVSGGIDSTFLYETIKEIYPTKTYPVNCYNPYEQNPTLQEISKDLNFIQTENTDDINYKDVLKEAFLRLPEAYKMKKEGRYYKKIFPCCYHIKHKMFLKDPRFLEKNTVIISGIKRGDGTQRRIWLTLLSQGRNRRNPNKKPSFFHKHKSGHLYCYPLRDYEKRELPEELIDPLYKKYPTLEHTGCFLCPILVLFNLKGEGKRYKQSVKYAQKLGVYPNHNILEY